MGTARVQSQDFDAAAEARALQAGRADVGAVVTFVGCCRGEGGRLAALEIEHYPGMAEAEIARVVASAEARWPLIGVTVIPSRAVFEHNGRIVAWVRHGRQFEMRKIEIGKKGDGQTQVLSGLQPGDYVALEEPEKADAASKGGA